MSHFLAGVNRALTPLMVLLLSLVSSGAASTIRVPDDYPSIGEAIEASSIGDTVLVGPGTYRENVAIDHYLTLLSEDGPASTTIDAQGQGTVVTIALAAAGAVVEGFRITGGHMNGRAGGIHVHATLGGGWAVIRKNIIDHNYAGFAPGSLFAPRTSVVEDNLIQDNTGAKAEAVRASGSVRRNIIRRNGSDLVVAALNGTIENNLIVENYSTNVMVTATGVFSHNTVANNGWAGSAVTVGSEIQEVSHNIITHLLGQGEGLACGQNIQNVVRCNNVWGTGGDSYVGGCNDREGIEGNISLDPQFCTVGEPDYHLLPSSPCAPENAPPGCGLIGAIEVCGISGLASVEAPAGRLQLLIDPNPVSSLATVALKGEISEAEINIVDAQGRIVDRFTPGSNRQVVWVPDRTLASGIYFARVQTPGESSVTKFVLLNRD